MKQGRAKKETPKKEGIIPHPGTTDQELRKSKEYEQKENQKTKNSVSCHLSRLADIGIDRKKKGIGT